jgi:glutamine cyclotransferase
MPTSASAAQTAIATLVQARQTNRRLKRWAPLLAALLLINASPTAHARQASDPAPTSIAQYRVQVLDQKPQSRSLFVQGLEIHAGKLYVGTGLYGQSRLMRYDFDSGALEVSRDLGRHLFGEGITLLGEKIYQLTWRKRRLLIYDRATMVLEGGWTIPGQGWGLTNNGKQLIYSDGSDQLFFLSTADGSIERTLRVTQQGKPLRLINELEWINGQLWANVWGQDIIVIIDPDDGTVKARIDLTGLLPAAERERTTDVLNGIAHDAATGNIWVTGKRWPWLYRIRLEPQS